MLKESNNVDCVQFVFNTLTLKPLVSFENSVVII